MSNIKNILAATDFSSASMQAVDRGFMLSHANHAKYSLIHALGSDMQQALLRVTGSSSSSAALCTSILEHTEAQMRELLSQCPNGHGLEAALIIEPDSASRAISATAKQIGADLIVVGAHGGGFVQRVLIGSTPSRLIRQSYCPVLVVKLAAHQSYKRILVAVDFSPISRSNIQFASNLAPDAHVVMLHTYEVPFEGKMQIAGVSDELIAQYREEARLHAIQQLKDLGKQCDLKPNQFSVIVQHGEPARNILQAEEKFRCDLIVMGKHGSHATHELLLGSVTKRVLAESLSDVLVITDERLRPISP
jgi:CPA2 family monovalent cation:H+ antiporter-2